MSIYSSVYIRARAKKTVNVHLFGMWLLDFTLENEIDPPGHPFGYHGNQQKQNLIFAN